MQKRRLLTIKNLSLSRDMTVIEFENGYWYAEQLKIFAKKIGIPQVAKLRKDEIEKRIKTFLATKKVNITLPKRLSTKTAKTAKDIVKKLMLATPVVNYISNKITKNFLQKEISKIAPHLKKKSGDGYWINRWREEQLEQGKKITYGDLVKRLVELRRIEGRLPQIPSTKYNNFVSDYLAHNKDTTKSIAIKAWEKLKRMDIPKTYEAYVEFFKKRKNIKLTDRA